MGIRMLHRRTAHARTRAQAHADTAPFAARRPVPAHAAAASTARVPTDLATLLRRATSATGHLATALHRAPGAAHLATVLRHANATLRHRDPVAPREPSAPRLWAELALSYLALALTLLPRSRPLPTMTVFIAPTAPDPVSGHPDRPLPSRQAPAPAAGEPDATP